MIHGRDRLETLPMRKVVGSEALDEREEFSDDRVTMIDVQGLGKELKEASVFDERMNELIVAVVFLQSIQNTMLLSVEDSHESTLEEGSIRKTEER